MCERAISIRLLQPVIRRFLSLQCWSVVDEWRITCQLDNGELLVSEMIRIRRKIKVERFTEKRRRDQWKINDSFFSKDTFVPKVFFFLPFFSCFIVIYMIIEEERIFINFLPRFLPNYEWLNYEFFLILIRYVITFAIGVVLIIAKF